MGLYYLVIAYDAEEFEYFIEYSEDSAVGLLLSEIEEELSSPGIDFELAAQAGDVSSAWEEGILSMEEANAWIDFYNYIASSVGIRHVTFGKVYEPWMHEEDLADVAVELIEADQWTNSSGLTTGTKRRTERHKFSKEAKRQARVERTELEPPSWRIVLTRKAAKAENKMPKDVRKIWERKKYYPLSVNPYDNDGKDKATIGAAHEAAWKLRIGIHWRAIFTINDASKIVTVYWLGTRESF